MQKVLNAFRKPAFWGAILAVAVGLGAIEVGTAEGWTSILADLFTQLGDIAAD